MKYKEVPMIFMQKKHFGHSISLPNFMLYHVLVRSKKFRDECYLSENAWNILDQP